MDQNEVTEHFSVGNTFRQATMHARIFCICCAEISDEVRVLFVIYTYCKKNQTIENVRQL